MFGINPSELNYEELNTYNQLIEGYKTKQIEVSDIRKLFTKLKDEIAFELCKTSVKDEEKIIKLQARLENMIMIEKFLIQPEQAEIEIRKQLQKLSNNLEKGITLWWWTKWVKKWEQNSWKKKWVKRKCPLWVMPKKK